MPNEQERRINKLEYTHNMEYHTVIKKNVNSLS